MPEDQKSEMLAGLAELIIAAKDLADKCSDDTLRGFLDQALFRLGQLVAMDATAQLDTRAQ